MTTALQVGIRLQIRWLIRRDMQDVMRIESECFENGRTEDDFVAILKDRRTFGHVATLGDEILGYIIYQYAKSKGSGNTDKVRILGMAVSPFDQRKGVGRQLIGHAIKQLRRGKTKCFVKVPESNLPLQLLLKSCGFEAVKVVGESYLFRYRLKNPTPETTSQ